MNSKQVSLAVRSAAALLLGVLILTSLVSPALAVEDAGGGSGLGRRKVVIVDEEMGYLSLKARYHTQVMPTFILIADEERGFVSLKGAQPSSGIVASAPDSDEEMGVLSLHVARPSAITAHSPASISVDDEGMGYLSLKGAYYRRTPGPQPNLAIADDEGMGYLSLNLTRHMPATSRPPALVSAH